MGAATVLNGPGSGISFRNPFDCLIDPSSQHNSRVRLILMGSPGAGKGTLAARLDPLGAEHVSSGDLFRREIRRGTPVGGTLKRIIGRGELVPDEMTLTLMRKWFWARQPRRGFVLDGFPRTLTQARCFDEWMAARDEVLTGCVLLELTEEETVERLSLRRICPNDGTVYHLQNNPPRSASTCDRCGGRLVQRDDDEEEVVRRRYRVYRETTRPLADYYRNQGLLYTFSAEVPAADLAAEVLRTFEANSVTE